jgi:hypothetical protein
MSSSTYGFQFCDQHIRICNKWTSQGLKIVNNDFGKCEDCNQESSFALFACRDTVHRLLCVQSQPLCFLGYTVKRTLWVQQSGPVEVVLQLCNCESYWNKHIGNFCPLNVVTRKRKEKNKLCPLRKSLRLMYQADRSSRPGMWVSDVAR